MIRQGIKDAYYTGFYLVSRLLKRLYGLHYRRFRSGVRQVQVGCGRNYLPGFINIDGNFQRRVDYLLDVRSGLPFPDESIDFLYSCHMLEHVYVYEAIDILREWRRVLSPKGRVRLTLPDFGHVFEILEGRESTRFPRPFASRRGMAINWLFCDGQHKYAYTAEVVEELARQAGFARVESVPVDRDERLPRLQEPPGSFSVSLYKA